VVTLDSATRTRRFRSTSDNDLREERGTLSVDTMTLAVLSLVSLSSPSRYSLRQLGPLPLLLFLTLALLAAGQGHRPHFCSHSCAAYGRCCVIYTEQRRGGE